MLGRGEKGEGGSSKQPQRIYLTEGERRERESRETFWMGMQMCAHETTLRLCYLSLPPYKLQYTTAGCCLSVTTTIVQISSCSQAPVSLAIGPGILWVCFTTCEKQPPVFVTTSHLRLLVAGLDVSFIQRFSSQRE